MKEQQGNRISSGVIAAISAVVVAIGAGVAFYTFKPNDFSPPEAIIDRPNEPQPSQTPQPSEKTAEVYWLKDTGTKLEIVPQPVTLPAGEPSQVLKAAFDTLLAGPTEGTGSTTIPPETEIIDVKQESDGIHVNLSEEFISGGGSSSMIGRVGQVVYTATTLNPDAKVYIEVNGKQLDVLGGEGLELPQPLTRQSYHQEFEL